MVIVSGASLCETTLFHGYDLNLSFIFWSKFSFYYFLFKNTSKIDAPQPPKHFPNLDPRKDISTSPLVSTATDLLLQLCDQMHIAYGFTAFTMTKVVELNETDVPSFYVNKTEQAIQS